MSRREVRGINFLEENFKKGNWVLKNLIFFQHSRQGCQSIFKLYERKEQIVKIRLFLRTIIFCMFVFELEGWYFFCGNFFCGWYFFKAVRGTIWGEMVFCKLHIYLKKPGIWSEDLFLSKLQNEWHKLQPTCPEEHSEEKFFKKENSKKVNEIKRNMELLALHFVRVFEPAVTTTGGKICGKKSFYKHSYCKNCEKIKIFLLSKFQIGGPNCHPYTCPEEQSEELISWKKISKKLIGSIKL